MDVDVTKHLEESGILIDMFPLYNVSEDDNGNSEGV